MLEKGICTKEQAWSIHYDLPEETYCIEIDCLARSLHPASEGRESRGILRSARTRRPRPIQLGRRVATSCSTRCRSRLWIVRLRTPLPRSRPIDPGRRRRAPSLPPSTPKTLGG